MSLILCPECGTKISDRAVTCPYCGFRSKKVSIPISKQDVYTPVPVFKYDIEEWKPNRGTLTELPIDDNRQLFEFFGKWKNIEMAMPALAQVIQAMAKRDNVLVADLDQYVAKLVEKGIYRFVYDKNGEILPVIRDADKIVKQIRLKEVKLSPQLSQSLTNLAMQVQMAQILDEIEYVGDAIRNIHKELQNDRFAMAESAWDKLRQARQIQDSRLREVAVLSVIGTATEAKRILMRNFADNRILLEDNARKPLGKMMLETNGKRKDMAVRAEDAFQELISITNCVQVECEGYSMLSEYDACKESLVEFRGFVKDNKLDERDTLLRLNGNLKTKQINLVDSFSDIATRILEFDAGTTIDFVNYYSLEDKYAE